MGLSTIKHSVLVSNYHYRREQFTRISREQYTEDEYCKRLRNLSRDSYRLGICKLFATGLVAVLQEEFRRSGVYRKELEQLVYGKDVEIRWYALVSHYLPLLAVFCADGIAAVRECDFILFPFLSRYEYEEDYCYGEFFYTILNSDGIIRENYTEEILLKLGKLDERDAPRYTLIEALKKKDTETFNDAMNEFVQEYADFYDAMEGTLSCDKEAYSTERLISIEAWAWLKIASLNGLNVFNDYYCIPQLVRHLL